MIIIKICGTNDLIPISNGTSGSTWFCHLIRLCYGAAVVLMNRAVRVALLHLSFGRWTHE
jgi:hypothetical protein